MTKRNAVNLLSGGLDSATSLAIARSKGYACYALTICYGQRHQAEINAARQIGAYFGVEQHLVFDLPIHYFGHSSLTDFSMKVPDFVEKNEEDIPSTYVPARNTIFLSIALGWAETLPAFDIFIGANVIDYSNYPDCRPDYLAAFEQVANLGTRLGTEGKKIHIRAPLLQLSKAEIIKKGIELDVDYRLTVSCYQATTEGLACGRCDSCMVRRRGFETANIDDPTQYVEYETNL